MTTVPPNIVILLVASEAQALRTINRAHLVPDPAPPTFLVVVEPADVPIAVASDTRVHVADGWPHNELIIDKLRILHTRFGLVDPCGILGVETSTTQTPAVRAKRVITDAPPIGNNLRSNREAPPKRKPQPTRANNARR